MKKLLTLLTFVFLTNALLFGQCPYRADPNPDNQFFNLRYTTEAERDAALVGLASITFPLAAGGTVDILLADLLSTGPHGNPEYWRIRANGGVVGYFGGENGNFEGNITFNYTDGSTESCDYEMTTSNSNINGSTPVAIFPNPVKDQLTIINGEGQATIYNVLGQAVKHLTIDANQVSIQLADLLKGQYYLQVLKEDGIIVTRQFSKVD